MELEKLSPNKLTHQREQIANEFVTWQEYADREWATGVNSGISEESEENS